MKLLPPPVMMFLRLARLPACLSLVTIALVLPNTLSAQTIIYEDDFSSGANWTTNLPDTGIIAGFNTEGKFRFRDGNGTLGTTSADRWASIYKTSALTATGDYDPVLNNSGLPVEWSFVAANPFGSSRSTILYGAEAAGSQDAHGFIVGATSADFRNEGQGYAVVFADGPDDGIQSTLQFIKFDGGLVGTVTTLLTWSSTDDAGLHSVGATGVAVRLVFDPSSGEWTLQGQSGFPAGFYDVLPDPLALEYTAAQTKSIVDTSFTGENLGNFGGFLSVDDGIPQTYLDNLTIQTIPEPGAITLLLSALGALLIFRRRR